MRRSTWLQIRELVQKVGESIGLFLKGSFLDLLYRHTEKEMARRMDFFWVLCFGELIGLPVPAYVSLKLLPYFLEELPGWQRRMARGRPSVYDRMGELSREF